MKFKVFFVCINNIYGCFSSVNTLSTKHSYKLFQYCFFHVKYLTDMNNFYPLECSFSLI